jgi:tetratricopeptide (TPR) repeat protein
MADELEADDLDAARRAFNAAQPIMTGADRRDLAGHVRPTPATVRALMGEVELREGNVKPARELLTAALAQEKSGVGLLELAQIDRYEGQHDQASARLKDALSAEDARRDAALRGEIWLLLSDIARERGNAKEARSYLTTALSDLAKARSSADAEERARTERVLARVLDRFGANKPAEKALERALDAAPRDKRQAAATVGQLVARAFVRQDLKAARDALARGVALDLSADELVYEAVWIRLLERQQKAAHPDPLVERVLASSKSDPRWLGRIASFGLGLTSPDELRASAKNPAQRTEAAFYRAMTKRVAGDSAGANEALKDVMNGGGLELIEVALARDLLDDNRAVAFGPLPEVSLP